MRENHTIYFCYAEPVDGGARTALARARLVDEGTPRLDDVKVIFRQDGPLSSGNHFGCRIVQTPDDNLFLTTGRAFQRPRPGAEPRQSSRQDHSHPAGRLGAAGQSVRRPPGAKPEIWSYGHRNPQGLALHPATGKLWEHEHGPRGGDEINIIEKGKNYGWPVIGYGIDYNGARIHESTHKDGMEQPIWYWVPSIAPSGMAFYTGELFPAWRGNLFVGALAGQTLVRLELDGEKVVKEERLLQQLRERIRDVRQGPDGALWLATDNRRPDSARRAGDSEDWTSHSRHEAPLLARPDPINDLGRTAPQRHNGVARGRRPVSSCAMFTFFERLLKPTDTPERTEPPPGFIAFFWHFARQAKGLFAALFAAGFVVALLDSTIPVFMGRIVTLITASPPDELFAKFWPHLLGMAAGAADRAAARAHDAEPHRQPGDLGQRLEPHPLAEPLVRGAAVLGVLPERLRRPHRQPRDADRAGDPRDAGRAAHQRLVHPGLRHHRADPARVGRSLAGAAGRAVVPRLSGDAARAGAAHARPLQGGVRGALDAHRAHRRQLHQHPDGEAVRARARGGRLCARRHR